MFRPTVLVAGALALLALTICDESRAGHFSLRRRGTPPPGKPRAIEHTHARAGDPLFISPHAAPTMTPAYAGYSIGGGSAMGGDHRRREEGTWGRDYVGLRLPRNVALGWSHGRREQGGTGSYTTDRIESADTLGSAINGLRGRRRGESPEP